MAVEPTGRFTKEGKPIFRAAPTESDVQREVSAQRVQVFGSGARKISDTGRVKLPSGEFVTPEKALAVSPINSPQAEEAERKIKRRKEQERTIRARLTKEVEKARKVVKLSGIQERTKATLQKQGKDVRIVNGQLVLFEDGRRTIITKTGATATVPEGAEVSVPFLEKESLRRRRQVGVRPISTEEAPKDFISSIEEGSKPEVEPITEQEAEADFNQSLALPELGVSLAEKPIQQTLSLGDTSDFNSLLNLPPTPEELIEEVIEERKEERGFVRRLFDPAISLGREGLRGVGQLIFIPNFADVEPKIELGQSKFFGRQTTEKGESIFKERGVQTAVTIAGITAIAGISPGVATAITFLRRGVGGVKLLEFAETGEPEALGTSLLLFSPEIIGAFKGVKFKVPVRKETPSPSKFIDLIRGKGGGFEAPPTTGPQFQPPATDGAGALVSKTLFRGISIEAFSRSFILGGFGEGKLTFGTPTVDIFQAESAFIVETAGETAILQKSLPTRSLREQLRGGVELIRPLRFVKSKFIQDALISDTRTLSPRGVKEVIKFTKEQKGELFGSFPTQSQLPAELRRDVGDIDVKLKTEGVETEELASRLVGRLRAVGERGVRISSQSKTLIEKKISGEGFVHAVDVKSISPPLEDILDPAVATEQALGFSLTQKPIKIGGVKVSPLGRELVAKGASIFTLKPIKDGFEFGPKEHRTKDIADFFTISEALIRSKPFGRTRLTKEFEQLKGKFPGEKVTGARKIKIPLEDDSPIPSPVSAVPLPSLFSPSTLKGRLGSLLGSPSKLSRSISRSVSPRPSPSRSPSASPSLSPSVSPSVSRLSRSVSRSLSASSASVSPSISRSLSSSLSSVSPSPSLSSSISSSSFSQMPSPSPSLFPGLPRLDARPKRRGYNVFVKSKGKFKQVNKGPLTKSSALGRGAFLVDNSTAAQFKVRKSKSTRQPRFNANDGYFDLNRFKFRAFRRRLKRKKGIIGPLPQNQFIERRTNRIDTLGEKDELSLAKLLAQSNPLNVGRFSNILGGPRRKPKKRRKRKR